jgi:hypothetical protein
MTTELRISGGNLQMDAILRLLQERRIAADVHACTTTTKTGEREEGVQILARGATRQQVLQLWNSIQSATTGLLCGHVKTEDGFAGCVHDFSCGTRCPHALVTREGQ